MASPLPFETNAFALYTTAVADTNGVIIPCKDIATVCVQITGTMANSSTVYFEGTEDGTNYLGILGWNRTTGVKAVSTTATGIFVFNVIGLTYFRARFDFQTGTSSVTAYATCSSIPIQTLVTAS